MGCGSSSPGTVVTTVPSQQATVVTAPQQTVVQYPSVYPQQQTVNRGYPQQRGPPPGYYNQRPYPGYGAPGVVQQPQTVVVQNRDNGSDFLVGAAAGALLANSLHGPHYYGGYGGQHIHIHDHDHFHDGGDHYHEHNHYGGPEYHEHYGGDTGGFQDSGGFDDGGGFDGGGDFDGGFD